MLNQVGKGHTEGGPSHPLQCTADGYEDACIEVQELFNLPTNHLNAALESLVRHLPLLFSDDPHALGKIKERIRTERRDWRARVEAQEERNKRLYKEAKERQKARAYNRRSNPDGDTSLNTDGTYKGEF